MQHYSDEELEEILKDLRRKKNNLTWQILNLDTKIIGIKEEILRRADIKEKNANITFNDDDETPSF